MFLRIRVSSDIYSYFCSDFLFLESFKCLNSTKAVVFIKMLLSFKFSFASHLVEMSWEFSHFLCTFWIRTERIYNEGRIQQIFHFLWMINANWYFAESKYEYVESLKFQGRSKYLHLEKYFAELQLFQLVPAHTRIHTIQDVGYSRHR